MRKAISILHSLRYVSVWTAARPALQVLGILWLVIEFTTYFACPTEGACLVADRIRELWFLFGAVGLLGGAYSAAPKLTHRCKIDGHDTSIEIHIGDLLESESPMVIPTNTTFDTSIADGTISKDSIQGQFTERFASTTQLDNLIQEQLRRLEEAGECNPLNLLEHNKPYGKRKQYPVGTTVEVVIGQRKAYLVAVATFNRDRTARASISEVLEALPCLWRYLSEKGDYGTLWIPIVGAGLARVPATSQVLAQEIIRSFVAANRYDRFCEKLRIVIRTKDYEEDKINLPELHAFLAHECRYSIQNPPFQAGAPPGEASDGGAMSAVKGA